jgi:hypothetical protein
VHSASRDGRHVPPFPGAPDRALPEPTYRRFAEASRGRVFAQRSSTEAKPATSSPAR